MSLALWPFFCMLPRIGFTPLWPVFLKKKTYDSSTVALNQCAPATWPEPASHPPDPGSGHVLEKPLSQVDGLILKTTKTEHPWHPQRDHPWHPHSMAPPSSWWPAKHHDWRRTAENCVFHNFPVYTMKPLHVCIYIYIERESIPTHMRIDSRFYI